MSSRHVETIQLETVISLASLTLKVFENRLYVFDISLIVPIANMHSSLILDSLYIYILYTILIIIITRLLWQPLFRISPINVTRIEFPCWSSPAQVKDQPPPARPLRSIFWGRWEEAPLGDVGLCILILLVPIYWGSKEPKVGTIKTLDPKVGTICILGSKSKR